MKSELDRLCERLKVRISCTYGANKKPPTWEAAHSYRVTLRFEGRQLSTDFHQGAAHTKEPTAADVLSCLISDASSGDSGSFGDFCCDFGYDTDSRKAFDLYMACRKVNKRLRHFLGDSFETFQSAEH